MQSRIVSLRLPAEVYDFFNMNIPKMGKNMSDVLKHYFGIENDVAVNLKFSSRDRTWIYMSVFALELIKVVEATLEALKNEGIKDGYTNCLNYIKSERTRMDNFVDFVSNSEVKISMEEMNVMTDTINALMIAFFQGSKSKTDFKNLAKLLSTKYDLGSLGK